MVPDILAIPFIYLSSANLRDVFISNVQCYVALFHLLLIIALCTFLHPLEVISFDPSSFLLRHTGLPILSLSYLQSLNLHAMTAWCHSFNHMQAFFSPTFWAKTIYYSPICILLFFHSCRIFSWLHIMNMTFPSLPCSSVWPCDQVLADAM